MAWNTNIKQNNDSKYTVPSGKLSELLDTVILPRIAAIRSGRSLEK